MTYQSKTSKNIIGVRETGLYFKKAKKYAVPSDQSWLNFVFIKTMAGYLKCN